MSPRSLAAGAATTLGAPVPAELLRAFRVFFGLHIFLESLKLPWNYPHSRTVLAVQVALFAATALNLHRRLYPLGLLLLLIYKGYWLLLSFPMAGNHYYAETLVLVLLLVFPDRLVSEPAGPPRGLVAGDGHAGGRRWIDGYCVHLVQLSVLSVYFFAGLHKLVHGFWLDGEFVTGSLFPTDDFGMWHSTRALFRLLQTALGGPGAGAPLPLANPQGFAAAAFPLAGWALGLFLLLSWFIVASEVGVPLLVAAPRRRRLGIWLMLAMQLGIGAYSWETEFMFGAMGIILLYFPHRPWRNYALLGAAHAAWAIFVVAADLRIGEL